LRTLSEAKAEIEGLEGKSKFDRLLHTAAIVTDLLMQNGIRPVIVGGFSVELYTLGGYTTEDLDFVLQGYDRTAEILNKLGFKKAGKDWIHPVAGVTLEIPDRLLAGDEDKVTEIPVGNGSVYVIGIEDLILDRLRSAVHWQSGRDREWGYRLLLMYYEKIDLDYIRSRFEHRKEKEEFEHWLQEADRMKVDHNDAE
jgi:hypothetical protein